MIKKLVIFLMVIVSIHASAQEKYVYLSYDVEKPVVNTDWINSAATRGFKVGFRNFITDKISAGLDVGSSTFEQYNPTETRQNGNGAITTDYFKYIYSYNATVSGQYNFQLNDKEIFFPYVGLGLGANTNEYTIYYNIYQDTERAWGFLIRPEAGMLIKISKRGSFGIMGAIHYDYSTNKSDKFNYSRFSSLGFNVGVMLLEM